jgi:predicted GIY-YIG superfamily endonuclease
MAMMPRDADAGPERTALYRFFDLDDELLYVGITNNPEKRWNHHRARQAWWPQVARKTLEWFDNRGDAEVAEIEAIRGEIPRHNRAHNINYKRPGPSIHDAPSGFGPEAIEKKIAFFVEHGFQEQAGYWRIVQATVDQAPPLGSEQVSRLRVLIWGSADEAEAGRG